MTASLAFGLTARQRDGQARLGRELERLGYDELWANDTRRGDGLETLADVLPGTTSLRFGVGVVALSDHSPAAIAGRVARARLPADRLVLGVGSGSSASLASVRDGVAELRRLLPEVPIAVAAVGPRMTRLAGEIADALVAAWALPERLAWTRERLAEGAAAAERPVPRLVAYVRVAVGEGAAERLRSEMDRYASHGRFYRRAFAEQPDVPVGVAETDPAAVPAALQPYRSVADTIVARGLPVDDGVDGWLEIARAVASPSGPSTGREAGS